MKPLILQAIQDRRLIRLTYDGLPKVVEPHVLGVPMRKQEEVLLCWQISPPMRQAGFWRQLPLTEISDLEVLDTQIGSKPEGPVPPVQDFSTVLAALQHEPPGDRVL